MFSQYTREEVQGLYKKIFDVDGEKYTKKKMVESIVEMKKQSTTNLPEKELYNEITDFNNEVNLAKNNPKSNNSTLSGINDFEIVDYSPIKTNNLNNNNDFDDSQERNHVVNTEPQKDLEKGNIISYFLIISFFFFYLKRR